jgi:hypothetical protein
MPQCTVKSKRSGERCRASAIAGAKTCRSHGSVTKRARRKAKLRRADAQALAALQVLDVRPLDHPVDELLRLGAEITPALVDGATAHVSTNASMEASS